MFCFNCGRSVTINDVTCPHCKARLGDVLSGERFPGNVFTSTQLRTMPEKKGSMSGIVNVENMGTPQVEDNVYSGSTYRAAFTEGETEEESVWKNRGEEAQETEEIEEEIEAVEAEDVEEAKEIEDVEEAPESVTEEEPEFTEPEELPQDIPVYDDEKIAEAEESEEDDEEERVFDDDLDEEDEAAAEEEEIEDDDDIDPFDEDRMPVKQARREISPEFRKTMEEIEANMASDRKPRSMLWGPLPFGKGKAQEPVPKHAKKDAPIEEDPVNEAAEPVEEVIDEVIDEEAEEIAETEETAEDIEETAETDAEDIVDIAEEEDIDDAAPAKEKKVFSFFKKKEKNDEKNKEKSDVTVDDDLEEDILEDELTEETEEAAEEEVAEEEPEEFEELQPEEEEEGEKKGFDIKTFAAKLGASSIVKYALYAVAGIVVVLGFIAWMRNVSDQSSNIAGVTHSVYNDAIAKLTAFVEQDNVDMLTQTASANEAYAKELMEEDRDAISALLPDSPQESDEVFLAAVTNVHKAVEDVIGKDAAAMYEGTTEERSSASEQEWGIINEAIESLKSANTATQVTSVAVNLQNMIMPAPTATPEPVVKTVTYTTLREGMSDNDDVAKLQSRLIKLGYLDGEADGDFGPKTTNAIKSFQTAVGMTADGVAGAELQEKLFADDAPKADK